MNFTQEQQVFISLKLNGQSVLLNSTAGSGKTSTAIARMKFLLENGIQPEKIIFFSFTNAAIDELKNRVSNDKVKITTIHSFCMSLLGQMGKFKKPTTFYDFIDWYKDVHKPKDSASEEYKIEFWEGISTMYDEAERLSSDIAAYKLQMADNIFVEEPMFFQEYKLFLDETKFMDFADMLIEVRNSLKENRWLNMFKNRYSHVFIDEYQDCSTIMMQILLSLNAANYYLIGDRFQSIFGYSGTNCDAIENLLKKRRNTIEMHLSTNFRSHTAIVENSNNYSDLKAIPFHNEKGLVNKNLLNFDEYIKLLSSNDEIVTLVRTNKVIKEIERRLLVLKFPIRYSNYITLAEIKEIQEKGKDVKSNLKSKVDYLINSGFKDVNEIISFILKSQKNKSQIMTIHRAKGKEFDKCMVVNSFSPEIIEHNKLKIRPDKLKLLSFDPNDIEDNESKCVHYVAVSRSRSQLNFMKIDI